MTRTLFKLLASYLILALSFALMPPAQSAQAATSELFFSEYIEGTGFNKALEIYNATTQFFSDFSHLSCGGGYPSFGDGNAIFCKDLF